MGFTDKEFEQAKEELSNPRLETYEFFVESHGVKVYRKYLEATGLYEYKIIGSIDVDPETCAEVYMDLNYRKTWDSYAADLRVVSHGEPEIVYWEVKYPWPLSNRDYVYIRQKKEFEVSGSKVWVVLGRSANPDDLKDVDGVEEKSGVIRVKDFVQCIAITSNNEGGTKAFMHYFDNPEGNIPTWLINWAASTGVPGFLSTMTDACNGYSLCTSS